MSEEEYNCATATKQFFDSAVLNGHLLGGGRRDLLTNSMNLGVFKEALKEIYPVIDNDIISHLVFCHYKLVGKDTTKKAMYIATNGDLLP